MNKRHMGNALFFQERSCQLRTLAILLGLCNAAKSVLLADGLTETIICDITNNQVRAKLLREMDLILKEQSMFSRSLKALLPK